MGIKNLTKLVKQNKPDAFKKAKMDFFKGKSFAVDISIYINKYVNSSRDEWLNLMTYFLMNLRYNDIDVIIIFDGKHVPEEKEMEREARKTGRENLANRCDRMEALYNKIMTRFIDEKTGNTRLVDEKTQGEFKELFSRCKIDQDINYEDADDLALVLMERLEKAKLNAEGVSFIHKNVTRQLIKAMGFSYIEAYGEAESLCSSLAFHGIVDGVISTDSDCFVYGTPLLIKDIKGGFWEYMELKDVLEALELEMPAFIDLCIALQCDYNKNMKGVGMKRAYEGILKYGSLDNWEKAEPEKPFEVLRYPKCREIFQPYSKKYVSKCSIKKPKDANVKMLDKIFQQCGSKYTGEYVLSVQKKECAPSLRKSMYDERREIDIL